MKEIIVVLLISALFLVLGLVVKPAVNSSTVVEVDPPLIEYHQNATGQQFTVAIKIVDVTNLYGFDIKLRWDTTYLDYVNHSVFVPKDTYPDGVLWNPILFETNEVNATAGTSWIAYASRFPAPTFNGTGTVFNMTFRVKYHPEQTVNVTLDLYETDLAALGGGKIPHDTQNGTVILHALTALHDIAVTNVTTCKDGCKPFPTVGQNYTMHVNVTVENQGNFTETFAVTVYANATVINQTLLILPNATSTTFSLKWNATAPYGNVTMTAVADTVPEEVDLADNPFMDGKVLVTIPGDITGDFKVNYVDLGRVIGNAYGKTPASPRWDPNTDFNDGNKTDYVDLGILLAHYGWHYP